MSHILYSLTHEYGLPERLDTAKHIGIYISRIEAEAAIRRANQLPGFREHPDNYRINEFILDQDVAMYGFEYK
jgi:hypothetical protein